VKYDTLGDRYEAVLGLLGRWLRTGRNTMGQRASHVCPVEIAGSLDNTIRRWLQDPHKILGPYVDEGMTALDIGCGPGFFSTAMAELVGATGHVIAADLQQGMLQRLQRKVAGTALEERIILHNCEESSIGVSTPIDFALAFYMVHEVADQDAFFDEVAALLKPNGQLLIVEPPFHVSQRAFQACLSKARNAGLEFVNRPRVLFSKTALMQRRSGD
jgi:ubiquinone/menaquinone biosynthesis C-methylase UbiE